MPASAPVTLSPAPLPPPPRTEWRLVPLAAFATYGSPGLAAALENGFDAAPVPLAPGASWSCTIRLPATPAGGMLVFTFAHADDACTAGFTASAETSLDSPDGHDGVWSPHPLALHRPEQLASRKLQKIDFDSRPRWLRLTLTAPASCGGSVRDLALHRFSPDGLDDYWLCVGASLEENGVHHHLFKAAVRQRFGHDPVLFNLALSGAKTTDWHQGHPDNLLQQALRDHPRARYVAFHLGGNDVTQERPYVGPASDPGDARLATELEDLLRQLIDAGKYPLVSRISFRDYPEPHPVQGGANPENGTLPYNLHIVDPLVAAYLPDQYDATRGLPRIDAYAFFLAHRHLLCPDGVHLNPADQSILGSAIWADLAAPLIYRSA